MMKSVTAGLGVVTVLAVMAAMTPSGLAMLGVHPSQTTASVSAIEDTPPPQPAPAKARPVAHVPPAAHTGAAPRPVGHRSARVAPRPAAAAAPASPGLGQASIGQGLGQIANIANILLNLPQVLSQSHGGASVSAPAPGGDPSWLSRRDVHQDGPDNASGEGRH